MNTAHNTALDDLIDRVRREASWYCDKAAVLRALLDALVRVGPRVDLGGVRDEADLSRRIAEALHRA